MDRRVTPPNRVTSPTRGPPPVCKQALRKTERILAIPHPFERLFLISWESNRDCHVTMPLSLKTMEVQIEGDQCQ